MVKALCISIVFAVTFERITCASFGAKIGELITDSVCFMLKEIEKSLEFRQIILYFGLSI